MNIIPSGWTIMYGHGRGPHVNEQFNIGRYEVM